MIPGETFFEKLTRVIYLDYLLKIVGVFVFAFTYLNAWHGLSFAAKAGFLGAGIAWFVGARFTKLYRG